VVPANFPDREAGYSIHTFIEGDDEIDKTKLGSYIDSLGLEMGKFHTALHEFDLSKLDLRKRQISDYQSTGIGFHSHLEDSIPDHPLVQEMYQFWLNWRDTLDLTIFTSGIVHGDIGPGCNIMIDNQEVTGFIDLIGVGGGLYMTDIASFAMYGGFLFIEERTEWFDIFKKNYLQTGPISSEEFEMLPFFILWRFLIQALYIGWRKRTDYTQGNTEDEDNQSGMNDAIAMLQFWKDQYGHMMKLI